MPEIKWEQMDKDLFVKSIRLYLIRMRHDADVKLTLSMKEKEDDGIMYHGGKMFAFDDILSWIEKLEWKNMAVELGAIKDD